MKGKEDFTQMEKIKEYITKNKKIVMSVAIIIILMIGSGIYFAVQSNNDISDSKGEPTTKQETVKTETTKDLISYVTGDLKNWTVQINSKNVDFIQGITFDKKVVKDVSVDASKVDLTKVGKYNLTYSIIPIDTTISKKDIIKTVEVVSKETAQKEADKGNEVITSDNEVMKNTKGNTPVPKKEVTSHQNKSDTADTSNSQKTNTNTNSNNNSGGGSKPNTENNSGSSSSNAHKHNFNIFVPEKSHIKYGEETYEEQVPKYIKIYWYECKVCHKHFDDEMTVATHCEDVCDCGYTFKKGTVQDGYDIVTKTRPTSTKVVDDPAHYECSCGARK